jgi:RNA polymerase sigma-70 factor, ECF subfamily
MCEPSDLELMDRTRAGDPAAFGVLIRRHQSPLLNFFRRLGAGRDAEDLAQEVFVRLYRWRDRYVQTAKFTTFLYTLARHVWADHWRKSKRRERIEERAKTELPSTDDGAWARVSSGLDAEQALAGLPEKLRVVLVMSLYQGLRYDEIAEVLGIPLGTVKSRVFVALQRLKEMHHDEL